jgi:hypothetical protein
MAWDAARPIPWRRLIRDWMLYLCIMLVLFIVVYRDRLSAGAVAGLLASGPLFVVCGAVLAKFGYQRKTLKELRTASAARAAEAAAEPQPVRAGQARNRPAPTKRTSSGPSNRPTAKRKR